MGLSGSSVLLLVQTSAGPPGVYFPIGSQTGAKSSRKTGTMDFSDKSTADKILQPGERSATITLDSLYVPGDPGLQALRQAQAVNNMIICEWYENGVPIEYANCVITAMDLDAKRMAPCTFAITLEVSGGFIPGAAP